MTRARVDVAGVALLALAAFGLYITHAPRSAAAADYADAADYNRAITKFLVRNGRTLAGRDVAVMGLNGKSPFSHTGGRYLTRLVKPPATWHVYVPRPDYFYPYGESSEATIRTRPESAACELGDRALYVVFDGYGHGEMASDCADAVRLAYRPPQIASWQPAQVTPSMIATGFNFAVRGLNLGTAVTLRVEGESLPLVRATFGDLMTASVPPRQPTDRPLAFTVEHRERRVLDGTIAIGDVAR